MNAIVGDENGILKLVHNNHVKSEQYISYGEQIREKGIEGLNWLRSNYFSVLRRDQTLEIWSSVENKSLQKILSTRINVEDPVNSVVAKGEGVNTVVCFGGTGKVAVLSANGSSMEKITTSYYDVAVNISAGSTCFGGIVFGGRESDAVLYDLETMQGVWHAENVPNDKLDLRVPIWITDIAFLTPERDSVSTGATFATGTGFKHVRLYDTNTSTQPVASLDVGEFRVTRIQRSKCDNAIYVADTAGGFCLWDLRMRRKLFTLKGCAGSIRDIAIDNTSDHVACVGLDRYLHVYNTTTNKVTSTTYLKSRLNRCILMENGTETTKRRQKLVDGKKGKNSLGLSGQLSESNEDILESYADSSDEDQCGGSEGEDDEDEDDGIEIDRQGDGASEEDEFDEYADDLGSDDLEEDEDESEDDDDSDGDIACENDNEGEDKDESDDDDDDENDTETKVYTKDGETFVPVTSRRSRVEQAQMQQRRHADDSKRKQAQAPMKTQTGVSTAVAKKRRR